MIINKKNEKILKDLKSSQAEQVKQHKAATDSRIKEMEREYQAKVKLLEERDGAKGIDERIKQLEAESEAEAPAEEVVPETPAPLYAVIAREEVKVYREAEADEDAVLATPARGSFYTVVERGEAWTKIELEPQRYGYVRSEDVEFTAVKPEIVVEAPEEEAETPLEVEAAEEAVEAEEIPVEDENEDTVEPEQEEE